VAARRETIWVIDPHTQKKHEILRRYFDAWLPIIASWAGRVLFIDGFAGPGKYKGGEDGSPLIVLKSARDYTCRPQNEVIFIFVEDDKARAEHLEQVIDEIKPTLPSNFKVYCVHGRFNEQLTTLFQQLDEQKKKLAPALVFIDPFGFSHTPLTAITRVLQNKSCEVLITFMYEEINRFLNHPGHEKTHDELFGTTEWRKVLSIGEPEKRRRMIRDIYLAQLQQQAEFVRSFEMLNFGNRTDYFLFFASNNLRGLEKMKEAMWRVDKSGMYQFSDYTDARGALKLFGDQPDFDLLKKIMVERCGGEAVSIEALGDFVVAGTPFLRTHIKVQILKPMEAAGEIAVISAKPNRRKGTFPPRTVMRFA
jgi:three-Cys-motif partner protein